MFQGRLAFMGILLGINAAVCSPKPAGAQLLGDIVNATYYYPNFSTVYDNKGNMAVSPTAAFTFVNFTSATVEDSIISTTFGVPNVLGPALFNGFVIKDTSRNPLFTGVSVTTTVPGFDISRVRITTDSVLVNFQGLAVDPSESVTIHVIGSPAATPEPGPTALLVAMGLSGAAFFAHRRARARKTSR